MLSNAFKPIFIRRDRLVRVRSLYDGGYVLTKELINNTKYLISFGISDNFDFEEDLNKLTKCLVVGYDYSINQRFWIERYMAQRLSRPFTHKPEVGGSIPLPATKNKL
jgi:hypothetical protein